MFIRSPNLSTLHQPTHAAAWFSAAVLLVLASSVTTRAAASTELRDWTLASYRVHLTIAVDDAARPQTGLESRLAEQIIERVDAVVAPLWRIELNVAQDAAGRRQCFAPADVAWEDLTTDQKTFDKLMLLGVRATPRGYELTCREYDAYLRRWGAVHRRESSQESFLSEACFQILLDTFAPLATIETLADDREQVQLIFKGSALPRRTDANVFISAGDAYQPILRRTDRTGELVTNGIIAVPWTYLTTEEPLSGEESPSKSAAASIWQARIHSGMRRPFGTQRRGLVQQVAIALRNAPGPSEVRFHARSDENQPLVGYEVFRNPTSDAPPELIGKTDRHGRITVPPGAGSVSTILLRSEGQLLAKTPVPTGMPEVMQTPIADNVSRLRAQAEAQVVREELIDIVARRAIMIARTKSLLKQGRIDDARQLMMELDELPTSSTFGRNIEQAAQRIPPSSDKAVQQNIDKLFSSTRELLSKFLSPRPIIDLQAEVNAAASSPPQQQPPAESNTGG